ncbi:MAG: DUF1667 domain-containing protein [Bacillota bacterium]
MKNKITCQVCPMACEIFIARKDNENVADGNRCGRGLEFVRKHMDSEDKIVTGRCLLSGGQMSRLPVATSDKIPVSLIDEVLMIIQKTKVHAPVKKGQILVENILGTGINVISQRKAL